jgi:fused signal recognition particle receptor
MFEGLKESISDFRGDVEDEIDEEAADAADQSTAEGADAAQADAASAEEGADGDERPDTTETRDETDGDDSPGLGQRARSLARGKIVLDADDLDAPLQEFELALLGADVAMEAAEAITDGVRERLEGETRGVTTGTGSVVESAIREALVDVLAVDAPSFEDQLRAVDPPVVIVFTGVNGVGKTTSIAKLARYLEERGFSSVLANGDTYRAGAAEQLGEHAEALGRPYVAHEDGGDPAAVCYDAVEYAEANGVDVVLADTAGRLHTSDDLMAQLEKIDRVVDPDLTIFVDEAVAGQDAVERAREFDAAAEIDGAILTKADADASGGAAVSIAHVTGTPIHFLGTGQGYDDLEPFDPEAFVDDLLADA